MRFYKNGFRLWTGLLVFAGGFAASTAAACSFCKITRNGTTVVGNNEDWWNPRSQLRFEPQGAGRYGYLAVGFDDNRVQGGMNEAGLVFDAFAMPYKAPTVRERKRVVADSLAIDTLLKSFATVQEVQAWLSGIDLSDLTHTMLVFADRSGACLRVEGDELFLDTASVQTFSNFYPSQTPDPRQVALPYYQNGCRLLQATAPQATTAYVARIMSRFKQPHTQYTTVYDLKHGTMRLYQAGQFRQAIDFNLAHELRKGRRVVRIPSLFPAGR